jgi:hypothetical protein
MVHATTVLLQLAVLLVLAPQMSNILTYDKLRDRAACLQ